MFYNKFKMKKLSVIILSALMLMACDKSNLTIKGTIDNSEFDGKKAYLINQAGETTDSAEVKKGKFLIKKTVTEPDFATLLIGEMGDVSIAGSMVVLEAGEIIVNVSKDNKTEVSGTKLNVALSSFMREQKEIDAEYEQAMKQYGQAPQVVLDSIERGLTEKFTEISYRYSKENANNLVGKLIFLSSYYGMTIDQKAEIASLFDEKTMQDENIAKVVAAIEQERKSAVGQPYMDFEAQDLAGNSVKLSSFVGKADYLLVDFWASWCGPCIKSLPSLKALYEKYRGSKFDIVGFSLDDSKAEWEGAAKQYDLKWHHMSDLKKWESPVARLYAVQFIPTTILLDKEGKIVGRNLHVNEIEDILKAKK